MAPTVAQSRADSQPGMQGNRVNSLAKDACPVDGSQATRMNTDSGSAGIGMNTDCLLSVFIRGYLRSSVLLFTADGTA